MRLPVIEVPTAATATIPVTTATSVTARASARASAAAIARAAGLGTGIDPCTMEGAEEEAVEVVLRIGRKRTSRISATNTTLTIG